MSNVVVSFVTGHPDDREDRRASVHDFPPDKPGSHALRRWADRPIGSRKPAGYGAVTGRCDRGRCPGYKRRGAHFWKARRTTPPSGGPSLTRAEQAPDYSGRRWSSGFFLRLRAGTAPGSNGRSRRSSKRFACEEPPSTFAGGSSTTRMSFASSRRAARVFVDTEEHVPTGAEVIFSAHGVSPAVRANARRLGLRTIDATCPLVAKVHAEARRFAARGYTVVLIGHAGHDEVEGTLGEAPDAIVLVENVDQARRLEPACGRPLAYITQTTLSVDETEAIVGVLAGSLPRHRGSEAQGHLLRDDEPPARSQANSRAGRPPARDRVGGQLELEPPGRGRARRSRSGVSDRRRGSRSKRAGSSALRPSESRPAPLRRKHSSAASSPGFERAATSRSRR